MDRLARNAMLAKQANMSYGKWKALQPIVPIEKPKTQEGWIRCAWCRTMFQPKHGGKYCTSECSTAAAYQRKKAKYRARKAEENGEG